MATPLTQTPRSSRKRHDTLSATCLTLAKKEHKALFVCCLFLMNFPAALTQRVATSDLYRPPYITPIGWILCKVPLI